MAKVHQFTLSDGRKLDYRIQGATSGLPLLWFHGTPGASLSVIGLAEKCEKYGLTLVTFSRPGYAHSTRQKGRSVIDTMDDAKQMLKYLGYPKFYAGGWSGGGPYALACAATMPDCLGVVSVAGVGPYGVEGLDFLAGQGESNVQEFNATLQGEEVLQEFLKPEREEMLKATPEAVLSALSGLLPKIDEDAIVKGNFGQYTCDLFSEGLEVSSDGWADDNFAFLKPWGFEVKNVKVPALIYQGDLDLMVPFAHGKWISAQLPEQFRRSYLKEGHGHISIMEFLDDMIKELVSIKA